MKKIGFIDNFLSEWHANSYPDMIRNNDKAKSLGLEVCYAYALTDVSPYDGVSTNEWCSSHKIEKCSSIKELVDKSDYIVVLSPDNPELHEQLADIPLRSGKLVYIDKTFAPNKASAIRLFDLAHKNKTPLYSTSSLRFADELQIYRDSKIGAKGCMVVGCFVFDIYAIHIFEMMCTIMKSGAKRMMAVQNGRNKNIIVDYGNDRMASYLQMHTDDPYGVPFITSAEMPDGTAKYFTIKDGYQQRFVEKLVDYFATGIEQVDYNETIDLIGMLDAAKKALKAPFSWINI